MFLCLCDSLCVGTNLLFKYNIISIQLNLQKQPVKESVILTFSLFLVCCTMETVSKQSETITEHKCTNRTITLNKIESHCLYIATPIQSDNTNSSTFVLRNMVFCNHFEPK